MWQFLKRLFTRKRYKVGRDKDVQVFANLDALRTKELPIVLHGKLFYIKPIKNETFMDVCEGYARLGQVPLNKPESRDLFEEEFYEFSKKICDGLSKKDIKEMTPAQCFAFAEIVIEHVTGKIYGSEKKSLFQRVTVNQDSPGSTQQS